MTDTQEMLGKLRDSDPVPDTDRVHEDETAAVLFSSILRRRDEMAGIRTQTDKDQVQPAPAFPRWTLAAAAAVIAILAIGLPLWLLGGPRGDVADTADEPTPQTSLAATTVETPVSPAPETSLAATTVEMPVSPAPETSAPPATSTTTTAIALDFAGVVPIDPDAAMQFGEPFVLFDSDGRPQVLYARSRSITALALCDGPECSSVAIHEIFNAGLRVGTPRHDSGPVFWVGGGDDLNPGASLVVCPDVECLEPSFPISVDEASAPPAIATDPSGRTIVVTRLMHPSEVTTFVCEDAACTSATSTTWEPVGDLWIGPNPSAVLRHGLPVVALRGEQGILIGACADPDCSAPPAGSGIELISAIPIEGIDRGPYLTLGAGGEPIALIGITAVDDSATTWVGKLAVVACVDASCRDWVITELATSEDMYAEWAVATGPDGRVRIAWTEYDTVFLATCHNSTCSDRSVVDIGHPADDVGLAFDANGAPVLATMSRERGLELVFCGDDSCRIGS